MPERANPNTREVLVDPFRMLYEVGESQVSVLGVIHQRRHFLARMEQQGGGHNE